MLLGLIPPDSGTVSVFGRPPGEAIKAGAVGTMFQTGALIRDLSVQELIAMMASLYPAPFGVDEILDLAGVREIADRRTQTLSRSGSRESRRGVRGRPPAYSPGAATLPDA